MSRGWDALRVGARELRAELAVLDDLVGDLMRAETPRAVAEALLTAACATAPVRRAVVLAGPEGQLPVLAERGADPLRPVRYGTSAVVAQAATRGLTPEVPALEGRAEDVPPLEVERLDVATDAWLCAVLPDAADLLVVPLRHDERSLGALVLEGEGRWRTRDKLRLQRLADHSTSVLRRAWQLEQVQRLAVTDGLTKIANRRAFESTLEREIARAERSGESLTLVLLDIDHFKVLNDTHGHQAGDDVLRNVAAALSCACRDFDTPARFGGEEFAVVLPGCSPEEALEAAERLRVSVGQAPGRVGVTASAGVATYPENARDPEALVRAADAALYASKGAGRDRCTLASGRAPEVDTRTQLRRAVAKRSGLAERVGAAGPA